MGLQVMLICKGPVKKRRAASETYKHLHFIVGSQFALQFNFEDVSRGAQLWFTQYNGRYFVRPSDLFKNNHDQFHCWLNFAFIMCYVWCISTCTILEAIPGRPYFVLKAFKKVWNMDQMRFACYDSSWNINFKIKEICLALCRKWFKLIHPHISWNYEIRYQHKKTYWIFKQQHCSH